MQTWLMDSNAYKPIALMDKIDHHNRVFLKDYPHLRSIRVRDLWFLNFGPNIRNKECDKVISRSCNTFATRYPQKMKPAPNTFKHIIENFKNFGSVKPGVHRNRPVVDNENIEIAILGYFSAYPTISTRQVALESGISRTTVLRILRKHRFHPYVFSIVQHLKERITRKLFFLDNIIWSDEAKFTENGVFNRRNSHYWSYYNVHPFRERNFQESWQFNAYCAIRNDGVVVLEFYQDNLNGERYLNILRHFQINYLDNLPLADYRNIFGQHDGALPHNGHLINNHLQNLFYDQWIANNGPHLWPPRSPDLSVLDFFREDCMRRVRTAFQDLDPQSIRIATHEFFLLKMCEECFEVQGHQLEHLLK
ncbi:hypothetical protein NQ318_011734 [Aromia moschata]|uniref:Transposase n=1 Tax=Aromia moschata TaxID=1265417 RepID=A0AAV8XLP9_9CUCU|nr:hypothetical protein NQ318_011734 [Aromia moschata]